MEGEKEFIPKELTFCPYLILNLEFPNFNADTQVQPLSHEVFRKKVSTAYRKLALKYHPDRHPGDDEKREMFERIKKASDILSNERKKKIYDNYLKSKYEAKLRFEKQSQGRQLLIQDLIKRELEHQNQMNEERSQAQAKKPHVETELEKIIRETKEVEKKEFEEEY